MLMLKKGHGRSHLANEKRSKKSNPNNGIAFFSRNTIWCKISVYI